MSRKGDALQRKKLEVEGNAKYIVDLDEKRDIEKVCNSYSKSPQYLLHSVPAFGVSHLLSHNNTL